LAIIKIKMKKNLLLLLLTFINIGIYSQTQVYDYFVDNNNDTIVGIYSGNSFLDLNKKKYELPNEKIKTIKHKDIIYTLRNKNFEISNDSIVYLKIFEYPNNPFKNKKSIYAHDLKLELIDDYMITKSNDTIFGQVSRSIFNKYKIIDKAGEKIQFGTKKVKEFRKDGIKYFNKKKRKVRLGDKKYGFLKLLIDGNAKLYEYSILTQNTGIGISSNNGVSMVNGGSSYESHYYIESGNNFDLVNSNRFYQIIKRLLPENEKLHLKIRKKEFNLNTIFYLVKYYNLK
jgi:hypothetical protein